MTFQSLDSTTYYLFPALGLIFALIGLRVLTSQKGDENAARIEMFGLKFQSSSAGTLVFLIGVAFLLVPLFVPRAQGATEPPGIITPGQNDDGAAPEPGRALLLPRQADAPEVEPNNSITTANQFALDFGAKGRIDQDRNDYEDWYIVDVSGTQQTELRAQIRSAWGGCRLIVFDANEQEVGSKHCDQAGGSGYVTFFNLDSDRVYLRVLFSGGSSAKRAEYEVFLHSE